MREEQKIFIEDHEAEEYITEKYPRLSRALKFFFPGLAVLGVGWNLEDSNAGVISLGNVSYSLDITYYDSNSRYKVTRRQGQDVLIIKLVKYWVIHQPANFSLDDSEVSIYVYQNNQRKNIIRKYENTWEKVMEGDVSEAEDFLGIRVSS